MDVISALKLLDEFPDLIDFAKSRPKWPSFNEFSKKIKEYEKSQTEGGTLQLGLEVLDTPDVSKALLKDRNNLNILKFNIKLEIEKAITEAAQRDEQSIAVIEAFKTPDVYIDPNSLSEEQQIYAAQNKKILKERRVFSPSKGGDIEQMAKVNGYTGDQLLEVLATKDDEYQATEKIEKHKERQVGLLERVEVNFPCLTKPRLAKPTMLR